MVLDPIIRRSILQVLYAGRKADEVRTPAVAQELGLDLELVEAYLDVMEQEGLVNVARRYGGGHGVELTSRGLLEAKSERQGPETLARHRAATPGETSSADIRARLVEQLQELRVLTAQGGDATLDQMKDWVEWTFTVLKNLFGGDSERIRAFSAVMLGPWPWAYDGAQADGYRERLPEWERLLKTWIREIDEFGVGTPAEIVGVAEPRHVEGGAMGEAQTEYFVAHEFTPDKTDDLRGAIDKALADSGLTPYYADNELRQGHIFTDKILPKIRNTRFGIYDISNPQKPNVFLELGAAIAMEKRYFIICRSGTDIPADIEGLDRIEYQSYVDLTRQLKAKVAKALRGTA